MIDALAPFLIRGIPPEARAGLANKSLKLFGSVIRNSNGSIAYHLQEAAPLANILVTGNPAALLGQVASEVVQISQNEIIRRGVGRIEQGLSSLNDLAAANLAFSAAGIGISVAGFALIDFRLKQIERSFDEMSTRLDQILSSIERVQHDRVEHDLGEIRGLAELFEESWLLTDSGRAESNWRRVYQDGAGLQEIFSRRARIALDRDRDDYSSADPFLEAFALISGLRIASLLSCNEVSVARRIEEDSTHRLLQLTGSISLIDLVRNALPDDLEKGTRRWQLEQAKACEAMRPVVARIRTREQLLATRTAVLPSLEAKNVSPRDWFAQTRSEDAEAIVLLRD